jgi:hypothetical protein
VPGPRTRIVSFTNQEGLTHSVEVAVASVFQAAALAVAEFRRGRFTEAGLESWHQSNGKSPKEQALKAELRARISE